MGNNMVSGDIKIVNYKKQNTKYLSTESRGIFIRQKRDMPILYFVATKNKSKQPALYGTTE